MIALIVFIDGMKCLNKTFNNLMVKVFDLNAKSRLKSFLNVAAMSHSPDKRQMLGEFIGSLSYWMINLNYSYHQAECFCNACLVKGQVIEKGLGHTRIFVYGTENPKKRTHVMSE